MEWMTRPPELATALTNLLNAAAALWFVLARRRDRGERARLCRALMAAACAASVLGFAFHFVRWPQGIYAVLWAAISALLCVTAALFALCAAHEAGEARYRGAVRAAVPTCAAACTAVLILALLGAPLLPLVVVYAGACLLYAGVVFVRGGARSPDGRWNRAAFAAMLAGGLAAVTRSLRFTLIWEFDYNTIFHLMTLCALLLFWRGFALRQRAEQEGKNR